MSSVVSKNSLKSVKDATPSRTETGDAIGLAGRAGRYTERCNGDGVNS